jgi:hypothetical protein
MATENESEKPQDAASEAKGITDQFVQTLGLVDLIIGGLALYWSRLWFGNSVTRFVESTGYPWLDIALLACGAAFVGKIISLVAELFAAFLDIVKHSKSTRLTESLERYRTEIQDQSALGDADQIDLATTYLINANPKLRPDLERIHNASTLAYSMTFLSSLFALYFLSKRFELPDAGPPVVIILVLGVLAIGFLVFGWMNQADYVDTLANNLNFGASKLRLEKARLQNDAEPLSPRAINVNLSAEEKISVELVGKPIIVEWNRLKRP